MTFSCNDLHWLDMRWLDNKAHIDPESLTIREAQKLIEKYPVDVSRHFMVRVDALMRYIKREDTLFGGKMIDYWWRIEFQNRGSPHLHMVVWIENHPDFETEEGLAMIDRVCVAQLPPKDTELYNLVKRCQWHHHTASCKKGNRVVHCRFNFPKAPCENTKIISATSTEFIENEGRLFQLKRSIDEKWINQYHPKLLELWKGNMDIQPCGSSDRIAYYIAKYISKNEPTELNATVAEAIEQLKQDAQQDTAKNLFKICMKILNKRQISACESAFRLCHLVLRHSSRKCIYINTRKPDEKYRVIEFDKFGNSTNKFCSNIIE